MSFNKLLPLVLAACLPAFAYAAAPSGTSDQSERAAPTGQQNPAEAEETPKIEEMVVTAHPLSAEGIAQASVVLADEELARKVAVSIGETVADEPGIHNSSFGVAVGRPVIHGLDGSRVRMLEDRIDTMDVSVTSGDHMVTVDPFIANRVEILKGSATLLYGSGAIGGVVDTHTGRIPHTVPDQITGKLDGRLGDNGDAKNGAFRLDGGIGNFAWHLDGFARKRDDYDIPGFTESSGFMAMEALHDHEEEHHDDDEDHHDEHEGEEHHDEDEDHDGDHADEEEEPVHGMVPGSNLETYGGAAGFSFIGDRGFFGVSVSKLDSEYGIPGHSHDHGHDHEHGHEDEHDEGDDHEEEDHEEEDHEEEDAHGEEGLPILDMKQTRIDVEAALMEPLPGFENLNLRLGINDYEHMEMEGSGVVGTVFENEAWEARAELTHRAWSGWTGAIGAQYGDREFFVLGGEAFTEPVDTQTFGLFWVGQRLFSGFQLEAGARYDRVKHKPVTGGSDSFNGLSASLGVILPMGTNFEARLLADYSTRAPVGEELYSNGPHLATRSFEIGDRGLDEERAINLSAAIEANGERWSLHGDVYYTNFSDFIYLRTTGEEEDELVVLQFNQADATFVGLNLKANADIAVWDAGRLSLNAFYDIVSAELDISGNDNLARIPPQRIGTSLSLRWGNFDASVDFLHAFKQNDVADFELATDAYDNLRAYVGWRGEWEDATVTVFVQGRNLTDDEQRLHTSIVKDLVPQPGRTIEGGVRVSF